MLWCEASGSDALSGELELGFCEGAPSGCLDSGSPFPCMASILEKQIAEAEQLFPGAGCASRGRLPLIARQKSVGKLRRRCMASDYNLLPCLGLSNLTSCVAGVSPFLFLQGGGGAGQWHACQPQLHRPEGGAGRARCVCGRVVPGDAPACGRAGGEAARSGARYVSQLPGRHARCGLGFLP